MSPAVPEPSQGLGDQRTPGWILPGSSLDPPWILCWAVAAWSIPAGMGMGSRAGGVPGKGRAGGGSCAGRVSRSCSAVPHGAAPSMGSIGSTGSLLPSSGACGMGPRLLQERRELELELLGIKAWIPRICAGQGGQEHSLRAAGREPCPQGNSSCPGSARLGADTAPVSLGWDSSRSSGARAGSSRQLGCQGASRNASVHWGTAGTQIRP